MTARNAKTTPDLADPAAPEIDPELEAISGVQDDENPDVVEVEGGTDRSAALAALIAEQTAPQDALGASTPTALVDYSPSGSHHDWHPGGKKFLVKARFYPRMVPVKDDDGKVTGHRRLTARRGDVVSVPDDDFAQGHVDAGFLAPWSK